MGNQSRFQLLQQSNALLQSIRNSATVCQGLPGSKKNNVVLSFPTVLVLHGTISLEAHACRDLAAASRPASPMPDTSNYR